MTAQLIGQVIETLPAEQRALVFVGGMWVIGQWEPVHDAPNWS